MKKATTPITKRLRVKLGRFYKRRDGWVVGPMVPTTNGTFAKSHPFTSKDHCRTYTSGGRWSSNKGHKSSVDLVREVTPKAKGKK